MAAEHTDSTDVLVIGAGFGGLGAALSLAEAGVRVRVCEMLDYPGGCASTFTRDGWRFEAGATLSSGLASHQLFGRWITRHRLPVRVQPLDPVAEFRAPGLALRVSGDKARFLDQLHALPGAPPGLAGFFRLQQQVADALWPLLDDPSLLPPLDARSLWRHAGQARDLARLAGLAGRPLARILGRFGLDTWQPLRLWLDAVCRITVQAGVDEAEAPFALAAMDYWWRGAGHVHGGIGRLAEGLVAATRGLGGDVCYRDRVRRITPDAGGWRVDTRRGTVRARAVVANLLPAALDRLLDPSPAGRRALASLDRAVRTGWGAAMLYQGLDASGWSATAPFHLQLVGSSDAPLQAGNHVFCSISGAEETDRGPTGHRTATLSTHVPMDALLRAGRRERAALMQQIHGRMRDTLGRRAPELAERVVHELPASPRTFQRFTGRPDGFVGGVPRRAGLSAYRRAGPLEVERGLWLVGDSAFPGQSTLAAAAGGTRAAAAILRVLGAATSPAAATLPAFSR